MIKPVIEIRELTLKRGAFKLDNIHLDIFEGEIFALLGKTGAGKTMLLEAIAGFYKLDAGHILIDGKQVCVKSGQVGFVYQDYSLFPHMTVYQNIAYGLKMRKTANPVSIRIVSEMAEALSIPHILNQYPDTLSGGERQRTALARALVLKPRVLLLDEPFAALDNSTKQMMYEEMRKIHEKGVTIVLVTHDFNEAQKLADRIGIISNGKLKDVRAAKELFRPSADESVNEFLGL